MRFDFNLDFKIDEFKNIMKNFKHAPLLSFPFMFSQPAFAADERGAGDIVLGIINGEVALLDEWFKEIPGVGFDIFQ